jgi:hypothetical protein
MLRIVASTVLLITPSIAVLNPHLLWRQARAAAAAAQALAEAQHPAQPAAGAAAADESRSDGVNATSATPAAESPLAVLTRIAAAADPLPPSTAATPAGTQQTAEASTRPQYHLHTPETRLKISESLKRHHRERAAAQWAQSSGRAQAGAPAEARQEMSDAQTLRVRESSAAKAAAEAAKAPNRDDSPKAEPVEARAIAAEKRKTTETAPETVSSKRPDFYTDRTLDLMRFPMGPLHRAQLLSAAELDAFQTLAHRTQARSDEADDAIGEDENESEEEGENESEEEGENDDENESEEEGENESEEEGENDDENESEEEGENESEEEGENDDAARMEEKANLDSAVEYLEDEIPATLRLIGDFLAIFHPDLSITDEDDTVLSAETVSSIPLPYVFKGFLEALEADPEFFDYFETVFDDLERGSDALEGSVMQKCQELLGEIRGGLSFPGIADSRLVRYLKWLEHSRGRGSIRHPISRPRWV